MYKQSLFLYHGITLHVVIGQAYDNETVVYALNLIFFKDDPLGNIYFGAWTSGRVLRLQPMTRKNYSRIGNIFVAKPW